MHRSRVTSAILLLILYIAYGVRAEEPGLKLKLQPELIPYEIGRDEPTDLFLDAEYVEGHQDRELEATGSVRLRKRGAAVFSDQLHLSADQQLTATGHVRFEKEGAVLTGDQLNYDLNNDSGYVDKPAYKLRRYGARGEASRLVMENRDQFKIDKATYTTCDVGDDDWYLRTERLDLDRVRDVGVAHDATVVFKGVPILYSPYLDFSLSGGRKSGLLPPVIGSTTQSGFEYIQPYYWNIAPNRDATIAPRVLAKRGVLMDADFRYLEPNLGGVMRGEYLPYDREIEKTRYAYSWQHRQDFGNGFTGALDLQGVSDDSYFTDLSDKIAVTSLTNLPREASLFYDGDWWNLNTLVQRFQTLQDPLAPVVPPYARVPQITLNMNRPTNAHLDFSLWGQYSEFVNPALLNGRREILYPAISAPFQTSSFYLTPKIGYNTTHYSFEDLNRPAESRNLPIYSVDSAFTFERETTLWRRTFLQTLEPRLYYVYIPFRPQAQLPNYDTALADFNFAQVFTYNKFSGHDRINDANQITAAVTSRLIHPDSGVEQLRFTLGQRYYFKQQEVSLTPDQGSSERSDVLAAVSGQITRHWFTDLGVQYSTNENGMERSDMTLRYQPEIGKMVNFGYHFTRNTLEQLDVSTQWPIGGRWIGLARYDYNLQDRRVREGLLGVEYNAGCWGVRFVFHRFVSATEEYVNAMFFQLELTGVSRIGVSPQELLRQNITGYTSSIEKRPGDPSPFPSY